MPEAIRRAAKRVKNFFIYQIFFWLIICVRLVPRSMAFQILRALSLICYHVLKNVRRRIKEHLSIAFGGEMAPEEIQSMTKQVFLDLGRNAVDALRLPVIPPEEMDTLVRAEGLNHLDQALARGKGVIAVTGHIGSWELMAGYIARKGYPLYVIGRRLYDHRLNRILVRMRESTGLKNIERGGSTRKILKALSEGAMMGILIDQDTKVDGVFVDFFGKDAYTPTGPVVLAFKTGSPIVTLHIHLEENNTHHLRVDKEFDLFQTGDYERDVLVNTQRLTSVLEGYIREHPTQWVWMHERWKTRKRGSKIAI